MLVFLISAFLQSDLLFSAQVGSQDRKSTVLLALEKVEEAAAKVQEPGAVIGFELPARYKPAANALGEDIVSGDSAPEKAEMQPVGEEYDELIAALKETA